MSVEASRKHGAFDIRWPSGRGRRWVATSPADAAPALEWQEFSYRYFHGLGRHDLRGISSYAAYRRSCGKPERAGASRPELYLVRKPPGEAAVDGRSDTAEAQTVFAAMDDWESEGGYTVTSQER
jgi:hypothetical protein